MEIGPKQKGNDMSVRTRSEAIRELAEEIMHFVTHVDTVPDAQALVEEFCKNRSKKPSEVEMALTLLLSSNELRLDPEMRLEAKSIGKNINHQELEVI